MKIRRPIEVGLVIVYGVIAACWKLFGIVFELRVLNDVAVVLLSTLPAFLTYQLCKWEVQRTMLRVLKIVSCTALAVLSLATILVVLGGKLLVADHEIQRVSIDAARDVVVYQINGGATTDFSTAISIEKHLGIGLKKHTPIANIDHVENIELEKRDDNAVVIKRIDFTALKYQQSYYADAAGTLKEGQIIK